MEAYLLTLALWFPVHTTLHEGAHAVIAKGCGGQVEEFKPYPHQADDGFYFGSVSYSGVPNRCQQTLAVAPYLLDSAMIAGGLVYMGTADSNTTVGKVVKAILIVAPIVDIATNVVRYARGGSGDFQVVLNGSF